MTDTTRRQCSFRGIPFELETISQSGGRRLSINEFPYQINAYIEDLGQKNTSLTIDGYIMPDLLTDTPYTQIKELKNALESAFNEGGIGLLELSYYPNRLKVYASDSSFSINSTNKIDFSVTFVFYKEIKQLLSVVSYQIDTQNKYLNFVNGLLSELSSLVNFDLSAVYPYKSYLATLQIAKEYIQTLFRGITLSDDDASSKITDRINNLSASDYADYFNLIYDIATYEKSTSSLSIFIDALNYVSLDNSITGRSNTRISMANNEKYLTHAFKQALIGAYAVSLTQEKFETRSQAIYHRANLSDLIDTEHDYTTGANFDLLTEVVNSATTYITNELANLSIVVTIEGHNKLLPATYWSYRLYGNLNYVDDLIQKNGIADPDFMPLSFKALSV
jgi:prophage DNA circulation protein